MLYRRNWGEALPTARFTLGKAGNVVNLIAIAFLTVGLVFLFFPYAPNPDAKGMNWSSVIYVACVACFSLYYYMRARYRYEGPVKYVTIQTAYTEK